MTDTYLEPESASLKAHLRWLATDFGSETLSTAADRIEQLEAALTQSQAEVAAAYERAAVLANYFMQTCMDQETDPEVLTGYGRGMYFCAKQYQTEIRALATPDQTSALDTIRAEARTQGMREAAAVCSGMADNAFTELAREHAVQCSEAILDAITKGAKA